MVIPLYGKSWSKLYIRAVLLNNGTSLMFRCSKMLLSQLLCLFLAMRSRWLKPLHFLLKAPKFYILWNFAFSACTYLPAKFLLGSSPAGFTAVDWRISFVKVGRALGWAFPVSRCQCSLRFVFSLGFLCTLGAFLPLSWDWLAILQSASKKSGLGY